MAKSKPQTDVSQHSTAKKTSMKTKLRALAEGAGVVRKRHQEDVSKTKKKDASDPHRGAKVWKTKTKLVDGRKLGGIAKYDEEKKFWHQSVVVKQDEAFILKPVVLTSGPLKGRRVLLLEDPPKFQFMKLPTEIRCIVYECLLSEKRPITVTDTWAHREGKRNRRAVRLLTTEMRQQAANAIAILRTSEQIFSEAAPILYANKFEFLDISIMGLFLGDIGRMRQHIKQITLTAPGWWSRGDRRTAIRSLADMTSLHTINVSHYSFCSRTVSKREELSTWKLVEDIKGSMKRLHKFHQDQRSGINVLDIFQVSRTSVCAWCNDGSFTGCINNSSGGCKTLCKDVGPHNAELTADIRFLLAKALNIDG